MIIQKLVFSSDKMIEERTTALWDAFIKQATQYRSEVDSGQIVPLDGLDEVSAELERDFDFRAPIVAEDLINSVAEKMARWQVHTPHRQYWGLYNPDTRPITTAADALVATFNPQLAAWSHAPGPCEMERHVLRLFTRGFGWDSSRSYEAFTSGGAEANLSGIVVGLTEKIPGFAENGSPGNIRIYVSAEAHHSLVKIAHMTGIGRQAIREIDVDQRLQMRPDMLRTAITEDRDKSLAPTLVVATAGTTAAGAIDPLSEIADITKDENMWLHVDAAWGGTSVLSKKLRPLFTGIEHADSITADAHKWLSVPMGAGMSFIKDANVAQRTFSIQTNYMPDNAGAPDPYAMTAQWSRRFTGLKVFMAIAEIGVDGYAKQIERQAEIGAYLRAQLINTGWDVVNDSPLAVVCFRRDGVDPPLVANTLRERQQSWISPTRLAHYGETLRACVTNYRSDEGDVDCLIDALEQASK